jgi:release factor glutamine methyltransferase
MGDDGLLAELTSLTGSSREARWLLEDVSATTSAHDVRSVALALAARRQNGEPLQYLLGHWPFRGLDLEVDPRVLIPRPETEQLVEVLLERWRHHRPGADALIAVDLGTGSGAIGLSVAAELGAEATWQRVVLTDRSPDALHVAARNAERVGMPEVVVALGEWFAALPVELRGSVHLLAANPPYVDAGFVSSMAIELSFEPPGALFSEDAVDGTPGFADVEAIITDAASWLAPGGVLAIEMAEHQVAPAMAMAMAHGLEGVEAFEDLAGKPRGIVAVAP